MRLPGSHPLRDRSGNRNGFFALAVLTLRRNSDVHPAHPALFALAGEWLPFAAETSGKTLAFPRRI